MGQDEVGKGDGENLDIGKLSRNYFDFQYVIGKGGFSKVNKF